MKKVVHRKDTRGQADHGWLKVNHSFSFANYFNPLRMGYGVLRVLNDDTVAPKMGFGMHPHQNMEIITIPLVGSLQHKDDLGNKAVIQSGEVQVMSAGKGVVHSEVNPDLQTAVNLFQIWIIPNAQDVDPRYDQKKFDALQKKNTLTTVVSPKDKPVAGSLWIHQDAYISLGAFEAGKQLNYRAMHEGNGVYLMVINGNVNVAEETLNSRDALGVSEFSELKIDFINETSLLILDIPMN
ncbi:MAG: pirin family protein [Bacteroidetes bacterium]|nr:pirin family protein [Bacteroidota bacterium]